MSSEEKSVLFVDDEALLLEILPIVFKRLSINVLTASNGTDGLNLLKSNRNISCIISDIKMPGMSGVEFIKEVRKLNQDIPFIFFTGYGEKKLKLDVVEYGTFDFIDKPNVDGLIASVKSALKINPSSPSTSLSKEYEKISKE